MRLHVYVSWLVRLLLVSLLHCRTIIAYAFVSQNSPFEVLWNDLLSVIDLYFFVFFFSSRRRHTRYIGDWSSDVCSSDLACWCTLASTLATIGYRSALKVVTAIACRSRGATARIAGEWNAAETRSGTTRFAPASFRASLARARSEERRVGKEWRARGGPTQ